MGIDLTQYVKKEGKTAFEVYNEKVSKFWFKNKIRRIN